MLSQFDNETLTRVGPGTTMGDLLREYWIPAMLSTELPEPDCPTRCACACSARTSSPSATRTATWA